MSKNVKAGHLTYAGLGAEMFTQYDMETIHNATLKILEESGIFFEGKNALDILRKAGCRIDNDKRIAYFPRYLVEESIQTAPSSFTMAARNPANDYVIGQDRVGFCSVGVAVTAVDIETGETKPSTKDDIVKVAILTDYLENYAICFDALVPRDVNPAINSLHGYDAYANNNTKHILQTPADMKTAEYLIEMAIAVAGGEEELKKRNTVMGGSCPQSPLGYSTGAADSIIAYANFGLPNFICPMVMAGGSGPVTIAGTMVIHNAEILAGIVLSQSVRKGNPVIYGGCTTAMDLRRASATTGSPEHALFSAASSKIAKFYQLPCLIAGCWTDSKVGDEQCGHEKTMGTLLPAMAGANLIFGGGGVESGLAVDFAQLVADNDIYSMVYQAIKGMPVNADTLQLDLIQSVGPRGNFLAEAHTMENMRKEQVWPEFIDRDTTDAWHANGCKTMTHKAKAKAQDIIVNHKPTPLPEKTVQELQNIIARAEKDSF